MSAPADSATHTALPEATRAPEEQERRISPDSFRATLDKNAQLRLGLQRRANVNLRHHARRALVRFSVLVMADFAAFYVMRGLIRLVRDHAAMGPEVAREFSQLLPRGFMNGWQFAAALLIGLFVTGNYREGDRRRDVGRLFLGTALAAALPLWMDIWTRGVGVVLIWYLSAVLSMWLALVADRLTVDRIVALVRDPRRDAIRALFVGTSEECAKAATSPAFAESSDFIDVGFVDAAEEPAGRALGGLQDLSEIIQRVRAEGVIVCGYLGDEAFNRVVDTALIAGCRLMSVPRTSAIGGVTPSVVWRRGEAIVDLSAPTLRGQQLVVKRAMDVVLSVLGMIVLSPLFVLLAALVKLDSRGPVFFRQFRVGQGGRVFRITKFRTMRPDAEARKQDLVSDSIYQDRRLFKVVNDPRTTPMGRFLRRTSLDELPQLWNVLRGEMSLVGPRPPVPSEVALYEFHHYARFEVKPGITGPWQVNGRNEVTDFEHVVRLETAYIRDWSLWKDLFILARTVPVVINMRGAH